MADITGTTGANWLPKVWSSVATITYRSNTILTNLMDRRWEPELANAGDTVNIPAFSQNSAANTRTTFGTAAALTFDAITESQIQLVVNQMAYKAFRYPVELAPQFITTYVPLLTDGIGMALALKVDADLAGDNTNGIDAFTAIGTDNVDVTDDVILQGKTVLDAANAPLSDRYLVVSPASEASLRKVDKYNNSLYATSIGNIPATRSLGFIGKLYTLDTYVSNNMEAGAAGAKNGIFHKEAIAFAEQKSLTVLHDMDVEDGMLEQVVGFVTYGFKIVKSGFGREVDGK